MFSLHQRRHPAMSLLLRSQPNPKPTDPDPQGSSKEGFLAFINQIFGIDKSADAKYTAITFWSSIIGGTILGFVLSALLKSGQ